ncbi:MAG: Crp/Fnr family transcriptional regulator [Deltaproteobacteria bacterium]|jgi:CRP-like cAMP-binding protein|nr:MAG: Crp/Fnr family transcriptional regulator [Deltaproteobacteria bacterium]
MDTTVPEALRRTPLFSNLDPPDLARIGRVSTLRRCEKRDVVFREGEPADGFFIVVSGSVKICKISEDGKEQVLHIIEAGQSFAEATIFEEGSFPANAEALSDCELLFFPKRPFIALLEKDPKMALRMLGSLSKWLKRMTDLVENLALRDVEARLVFFVSEEMKSRGLPFRDGVLYEIPVSKNVLASRLGTVPETFSRTLKKLQKEGKIHVRGNQIRILKADAFFGALAF